jgi:hypothetical protein
VIIGRAQCRVGWLLFLLMNVGPDVSSAQSLNEADTKVSELKNQLYVQKHDFRQRYFAALGACESNELRDIETSIVVKIEWQGGCVNGKRDGSGVLSERDYFITGGRDATNPVSQRRSTGSFVAGRRLGVWCFEENVSFFGGRREIRVPGSCDLHVGDMVLEDFSRLENNHWKLSGEDGLQIPAAAVDSQLSALSAAARAGKALPSLGPFATSCPCVGDLLPDGRFQFLPSPVDLSGKRVAVVLSTTTAKEIARFNLERESMLVAIPEESGANDGSGNPMDGLIRGLVNAPTTSGGAQLKSEFRDASDPQKMLLAVVRGLRRLGAQVVAENDLEALSSGKYDYALVLEWRSLTDFARWSQFSEIPGNQGTPEQTISLNSAGADPSLIAGQAVGGLLFNSKLQAVRQFPLKAWPALLKRKWPTDTCGTTTTSCTALYLKILTYHYQGTWEKSPGVTNSGMELVWELYR